MPIFQAINSTRNQILADHVKLANSFFSRLKGLLFTSSLPSGKGLWLFPCNSIHCFGMAYAIDVLFLNEQKIVVGLLENFKPWRISTIYHQANSCIELPSGIIAATGTALGDTIDFPDLVQT